MLECLSKYNARRARYPWSTAMSQPSLTQEDMSVLASFKGLLNEFSTYSDKEKKQRENEEILKTLYPDEDDIPDINRCLETFLKMASYSQILIESEDDIVSIYDWKSLLKTFIENFNSIKLDGTINLLRILSDFRNISASLLNLSLELPKDPSRSKRVRSIICSFYIFFRIC